MEAGSSCGDSNAQGMGQSGREAEGTGASQQVSAAEPSWLREMRARYDQHDATPAGVVKGEKPSQPSSDSRLRETSIVIKPQRMSPCKKVAAVRIKHNRKDNEGGPETRGGKRKPSGPIEPPAQQWAGAAAQGRRHRDDNKESAEPKGKRRRKVRQQPKGYG